MNYPPFLPSEESGDHRDDQPIRSFSHGIGFDLFGLVGLTAHFPSVREVPSETSPSKFCRKLFPLLNGRRHLVFCGSALLHSFQRMRMKMDCHSGSLTIKPCTRIRYTEIPRHSIQISPEATA